MLNPPGKKLHTHYEEVRGERVSLPNSSTGLEKVIFSLLTRMEMEEEEMHDMMRELSLGEMLKKMRACLVKFHSILSKAFSRSILRIMFPFCPVIFLK